MADAISTTPIYLEPVNAPDPDRFARLAGAFIAGYSSPRTRDAYALGLHAWASFCDEHGLDPVVGIRRPHVELWLRTLEGRGLAANTRALRLTAVRSFFSWAVDEEIVAANPAWRVRPPRREEPVLGAMGRSELHRFLEAASTLGGYRYAILATMTLCALRVSEACGANIGDLQLTDWTPTLTVRGKGDQTRHVLVPPRAMSAIEAALDGRRTGALFLNGAGRRATRANVDGWIRRAAAAAGIRTHLTPHSLRRTAIQVALDSGVPLQDVQRWVGHAAPRTTLAYDRRRLPPGRSPGWTVMQATA